MMLHRITQSAHHPRTHRIVKTLCSQTEQSLQLAHSRSTKHPPYKEPILNRRRQILGRSNPHPLAVQPQRNREQTKDPHDHAKDAKGECRTGGNNPVGHEECPREGDDGADDGRHDEAVAVHGLVGVDDLGRVLVGWVTVTAKGVEDADLT
jgi:hypothetical protein